MTRKYQFLYATLNNFLFFELSLFITYKPLREIKYR